MIKEALQYLVGLGKAEIIEINNLKYSTNSVHLVKQPMPAELNISTLTGLVDYIKSNIDNLGDSLIQIISPTEVKVNSPLLSDAGRACYIDCKAQLPRIAFNSFVDTESFNIMLQSCFLNNDDKETVLKIVGNIRENAVKEVGDNGISQQVTVKQGIARVADVTVPNPVVMQPYRTFIEVEQPESKFIFRMQDGPKAALFEADGGSWKLEAMINIKEYLAKELEGCNVKIIA